MTAPAEIAWSRQLARVTASQVSLWALAAGIMVAAHAGAGWWALADRPTPMAADAPPAAIMIDLAPAAMAPPTVEENLATDLAENTPVEAPQEVTEQEVLQEVESEVVDPLAEEPVQDVAALDKAEPVEEVVKETVAEDEPIEEPVEESALPEIALADVPVPMPRPNPQAEKPVERKETPARPKPERRKDVAEKPAKKAPPPKRAEPQVAMSQARVNAQPSQTVAAPQSGQGAKASVSPARWESSLYRHLERRKRSSAGARSQQGTVYIRFTIDAGGNVGSVSLARSSGHPALDEAAVALVRRASPVPAPPPGVARTISIPITYRGR